MASESKAAVYAAMGGNLLIAITKFAGAAVTGSSAMLSEGVHSTVDTGNQLLLLLGMKLSKRPPDERHPFGHGKELYFWSLIVAVLIFGAGGGISAYEGILHMRHPSPLEDAMWNYVVLACAFVFESISLSVAMHSFLKEKGRRSFWQALRQSKNPATFTVLAEDSAALAGILFAAAGVYASHRLNLPVLDGAASLAIGLLLAGVAVYLIYETRGLLVGEGVDRATAEEIRRIASGQAAIHSVSQPMTMYLGPDELLLNLDVRFDDNASAAQVAQAVRRLEKAIRDRFPVVKRIFVEAASVGAPTRQD